MPENSLTFLFYGDPRVTPKVFQQESDFVEQEFGTQQDSSQMSITPEHDVWLLKHLPDFGVIVMTGQQVIGSTLIIPCKHSTMQKFARGEWNEGQVADQIYGCDQVFFESYYLTSVVVHPDHRGHKIAQRSVEMILSQARDKRRLSGPLYLWPFSKDGERFAHTIAPLTASLGFPLQLVQQD